MSVTLLDELRSDVAWGQIRKGGPFHAMRPHWSRDGTWMAVCNDRRQYGDLELAALDSEPGELICHNLRCFLAHKAWMRVHGDEKP